MDAALTRPPSVAERGRLLRRLSAPPMQAARFLLGQLLVRRRGGSLQLARIVETEAYLGLEDPAAHSFRGRTRRSEPLWGSPGTVYVYFIYGMHHCLNLAVEREGVPGCVLIRAAELIRSDGSLDARSCRGPGRLARTMGIDTRLSGRHLFEPGAPLTLREGPRPRRIGITPRVGIRHAADRPLRFFDADSPAVSGPRTISAFIADAVRSRLRPDRKALDAAYKAASRESWRRRLANEWKATEG